MASRFTLDKDEDTKSPEPAPFTAIPQALFKARTVMIFGEVDTKMAERVTANLLALMADDRVESSGAPEDISSQFALR